MSFSLEQIISSPAYPDEQQLAAILGQVGFRKSFKNIGWSQQVVTSMAYLALEGFKHRFFTCLNILLNTDSNVKINKELLYGWHMS